MAKNPTADIRDFLDTNMSTLNAGTNLFDGPIREPSDDVPKEAVFLSSNPGMVPMRDQAGSSHLKRAHVTVFVRSPNYADGYTLSLDIQNQLQEADVSGYEDVTTVNSGPEFGQFTTSGLLLFTLLIRIAYEE